MLRPVHALCLMLAVALGVVGAARAQDAEPEAVEGGESGTGTEAESTTEGEPGAESVEVPDVPTDAVAPAPTRTLIVVDAAAYGIDPIVGRVATDVMRRVGRTMGYGVLDGPTTVAAAQRVRMPYPPTPADLWRVTWAASAHRGAFARIWADGGRYVIEITVASMDGTGPFHARDTAGSDDLRAVVERLLRSVLQGPDTWNAAAETPAPVASGPPPTRRRSAREELAHPSGRDGRRWHRPEPEIRRFSLALVTEASIGATEGSFYNHYVGMRLDLRITRDFLVGVYAGYGNLEGRDQRVSSVYVLAHGEYRIRPSGAIDLTIPIRIGVGYLGWNGAVLRASAGLNYGITENWEIGVDLLAPTFYILSSGLSVAFDFSLEVGYRF